MDTQISLVEKFANYARDLKYEDIAPEAVESAKAIVFDSLGTGLGGYQDSLGRKAATYASEQLPGDQATVLGDGRRSTLEGAAFANATMIKILGMDDSHRSASHIAAQIIPAALAVGEFNRLSGQELIVAIVAGYDLAVRIGHSVRNAQRERGLDVKGTVGAIAAALASGLCAGLDVDKLSHSIALAADMSSGTEQYVYDRGKCDTKDLISGFAARNGVFATQLALHGFYGPRGALDGEYGFFRAFGSGFDLADFADLGQHFAITTSAFKPHGGCRHTHQAVDAVQDLLTKVQLEPEQIRRIVIRTYSYATQPSFRVDADPGSRELAGLSIRVATAIALTQHSAWPDDFEHWDDLEVRRLRHLTDIEVDPEIESVYPDRNGCRILVELKDGQTYEGYTPYAKGEPELPMTNSELKTKFDVLTRDFLSADRADAVFSTCMNLESVQDIGSLLPMTVMQ